jgi:riboflavin-specific deaminase-like protein
MKKTSLPSPFVLINMAMTADGKIATANRAVSSFGSRRDHEHLLELRATADAVLAGARTVDGAKINMGPGGIKFRTRRIRRGLEEFNLRVVASRTGTLNPEAEIFRHHFSPILILTTQLASQSRLKKLQAVADEVKICGNEEIDFNQALRWLGSRWGVRRLLCEGGGELNDALFRAGLVDELHLTICPVVFGGRTSPTIAEGAGAVTLEAAAQGKLKSLRRFGDELFLTYGFSRAKP